MLQWLLEHGLIQHSLILQNVYPNNDLRNYIVTNKKKALSVLWTKNALSILEQLHQKAENNELAKDGILLLQQAFLLAIAQQNDVIFDFIFNHFADRLNLAPAFARAVLVGNIHAMETIYHDAPHVNWDDIFDRAIAYAFAQRHMDAIRWIFNTAFNDNIAINHFATSPLSEEEQDELTILFEQKEELMIQRSQVINRLQTSGQPENEQNELNALDEQLTDIKARLKQLVPFYKNEDEISNPLYEREELNALLRDIRNVGAERLLSPNVLGLDIGQITAQIPRLPPELLAIIMAPLLQHLRRQPEAK